MPRSPMFRDALCICSAAAFIGVAPAAQAQPARTSVGPGFFAHEAVTSDAQRFLREWARPTPGARLHVTNAIARGGVATPFVVFLNCTPDPAGACHVAARFTLTDPDGKVAGPPRLALWDRPPLGKGVFMCGQKSVSFGFTPKDAPGRYMLTAVVTDTVSGASVTDAHAIVYG